MAAAARDVDNHELNDYLRLGLTDFVSAKVKNASEIELL
jgi:hypothetical protein